MDQGLRGHRLQGVTLLKSTQDNSASSILQLFPVDQSHRRMTEGGQGQAEDSGRGKPRLGNDRKENGTKQLGPQHAQLLGIEASANVRGELPAEHRPQQTPGCFRSLAEELLVLRGLGEPAQEQPFQRPLCCSPPPPAPPPPRPPPPPPTLRFELSMLNQRMEAQAMESWFMLEIITTGRVSVWEEEGSNGGERDVYNCRHLRRYVGEDTPLLDPSSKSVASLAPRFPSLTCSFIFRPWYMYSTTKLMMCNSSVTASSPCEVTVISASLGESRAAAHRSGDPPGDPPALPCCFPFLHPQRVAPPESANSGNTMPGKGPRGQDLEMPQLPLLRIRRQFC